MKNHSFLFSMALCGLLAGVISNATAETSAQAFSTVVNVKGDVQYSLGDNNWRPLHVGSFVAPGTTIRTSENGTVDIVLGKVEHVSHFSQTVNDARMISDADPKVRGLSLLVPSVVQNVVRLVPGTVLKIDKLKISDTGMDTVSDTELDLQKGKIYAKVKKLSDTSEFLIKLPHGIAGVRGTVFCLDADGNTSVLESQGGGLVLSLATTTGVQTVQVLPGYQASVSSNGTISITGIGNVNGGGNNGGGVPITIELKPISAAVKNEIMSLVDGIISGAVNLTTVSRVTVNQNQCHTSPSQGNQGNDNSQGNNNNQ